MPAPHSTIMEERNDDEEIEYDEEITFDDDQDGNENDADSGWGLA